MFVPSIFDVCRTGVCIYVQRTKQPIIIILSSAPSLCCSAVWSIVVCVVVCITIATRKINMQEGDFFLDGPVFVKNGVTLSGQFNVEFGLYTYFILYESDSNGNTAEEAVVVINGVTNAEARLYVSASCGDFEC